MDVLRRCLQKPVDCSAVALQSFSALFLGSTVQSRVSGAVCGIVTEGEVSNVAQACRATACYS